MLTELRIRNVAIIDTVTLPLAPGFNVLSGETGAGKSIIVEALGLLFGERGSADLVRPGADKASVEGSFDAAAHPATRAFLDAKGIEIENDTVVFRREVSTTGRSRAWINGTVVTSSLLGEVGAMLVAVHGQHASQALLQPEVQRDILDAFGGSGAIAAAVAESFDKLAALREQIRSLVARRTAAEKRADYLRHVAREISDARLVAGEDARLDEEAHRLTHVEELRQHAQHLRDAIDHDENGALRALGSAQRALGLGVRLDPSLARLADMLESAFVHLGELSREIGEYESQLEVEPDRLLEVEHRRDVIYRLTKKYGGSIDAALAAGLEAEQELELLDTASLDLGQLTQREVVAQQALTKAGELLSVARGKARLRLHKAVDAILPDLGMSGGRLTVVLAPRESIGRSGAEDVEYRVTLNAGHEPRPLSRVASGGELSRVMLALKAVLARLDRVPTLVFDEVDAGIGGKVGLSVGDTMRRLAEHHQVFAISHLPQIASRAHHHVVVRKGAKAGVTTADVRVVRDEERVEEIARMLGGDPESATSRAHARELLSGGVL